MRCCTCLLVPGSPGSWSASTPTSTHSRGEGSSAHQSGPCWHAATGRITPPGAPLTSHYPTRQGVDLSCKSPSDAHDPLAQASERRALTGTAEQIATELGRPSADHLADPIGPRRVGGGAME